MSSIFFAYKILCNKDAALELVSDLKPLLNKWNSSLYENFSKLEQSESAFYEGLPVYVLVHIMVCNVPLEFGIDILTFQIRVWTFLVVSLFEDLNSNFRHVKLSRPKQGLKIYMPMSFVLTGLILLPNLEATQKKIIFQSSLNQT